jgi:3-methyladenine DNA glycosylase AlkD
VNAVQQQALSELKSMAEEGYRAFMSKLNPSEGREVLGVRMPKVRSLAGRIAKSGKLAELMEPLPKSACYELVALKAAAFEKAPWETSEIQSCVSRFIPELDGWGSCDTLAASLKDARVHPEEWWNFARKLYSHPHPYGRRLAMVLSLWYFCDAEHVDEALSLIGGCDLSHFYAGMGAAWALSMYYVRFPKKVGDFVEFSLKNREVAARAMTKALESRQVKGADRALARAIRSRIRGG